MFTDIGVILDNWTPSLVNWTSSSDPIPDSLSRNVQLTFLEGISTSFSNAHLQLHFLLLSTSFLFLIRNIHPSIHPSILSTHFFHQIFPSIFPSVRPSVHPSI